MIPVGDRGAQGLLGLTRRDGDDERQELGGCVFVDLVGADGWQSGPEDDGAEA